jgi:hypothetical protein
MPHALGAFSGVDLIDELAQVNRLIGAFGFAHITVDAFIGDHQRHVTIITLALSTLNAAEVNPHKP